MSLRDEMIKLAAEKPELRKHLVPILREAADDPKKMKIIEAIRDFMKRQRTFFGFSDVGGDEIVLYRMWLDSPHFPKSLKEQMPNTDAENFEDAPEFKAWKKTVVALSIREGQRLDKLITHEFGQEGVHTVTEEDKGESFPEVSFAVVLPRDK